MSARSALGTALIAGLVLMNIMPELEEPPDMLKP